MTDPNQRRMILLIEDNPDDAELAMRALSRLRLGTPVLRLGNGADGLDYIFCRGEYAGRSHDSDPSVIFLDLKLPLVDGMEVLRSVKSNPATATTPVVVLTSSREERDIIESYALGVNSYIVKPVEFDQFIAAVQQLGVYWTLLNEQL
jgi:two-component system, response regulator